jgi:hypothetical protein
MVLTCFKAVTRLQVNMEKSETIPVGEGGHMSSFADILCCRVGSLLLTYLGMPSGTSYKALLVWNPILEKIKKRLSDWKRLYLSIRDRLT